MSTTSSPIVANGLAKVQGPTLHLGTYRRAILAITCGNDLFTAAEQLRANHNVHECEDSHRLALWLRNVQREATRREEAATQSDAAPLTAEPVSSYATAIYLLPAATARLVKPAAYAPSPATVAKSTDWPKPAWTGRAADHAADLADYHLEQWYIRETGLSFADLIRL